MSCMCGDPYCPSCGPAQGNVLCPYCGAWSADGGCQDPEACRKADDAFCDAMIAQAKWEREHAAEIAALLDHDEPAP